MLRLYESFMSIRRHHSPTASLFRIMGPNELPASLWFQRWSSVLWPLTLSHFCPCPLLNLEAHINAAPDRRSGPSPTSAMLDKGKLVQTYTEIRLVPVCPVQGLQEGFRVLKISPWSKMSFEKQEPSYRSLCEMIVRSGAGGRHWSQSHLCLVSNQMVSQRVRRRAELR